MRARAHGDDMRGTRQQLLDHLHANGIPIGKSTLDKMCAPSVDLGPPVADWFGSRPLYDFDEAIGWAKSLLSAQRGALPQASPSSGRLRGRPRVSAGTQGVAAPPPPVETAP
jgi:hypothetical protein